MDRPEPQTHSSFCRLTAPSSTLVPALAGSVLCWLAFPPVGWSYLAWVGPVPWMLLVLEQKLPGRGPYRALWLSGVVFWLLAVHWIRLPHPLNYVAWFALAAYLGVYLPTFVALSRVGVLRLGLPLVLVAPVVWTGLDWFRGRLFTGFLMGSLAHTQVNHLSLIQIADLTGEYGVTFLIILVAASIAQTLRAFSSASEPGHPRSLRIGALLLLLPAAIALAVTAYRGQASIAEIEQQTSRSGPRIALIQGNSLADWKSDAEKQQQIMDEYLRLSRQAVRDNPDIDLVIWPETAFRETLVTVEEGYPPPPERVPQENIAAAKDYLKLLTRELGTAVLVGIDRVHVFPDATGQPTFRAYNSSVLVDASGQIVGTYDKMHRVPFGEYIPFADWLPALYKLTPLTGGIEAGTRPAGLVLNDVVICPSICYETAVPQLISTQASFYGDYSSTGYLPVLVNLTNDAWFWGSSELDMHLACGVFRAVENRIPLVIAANGGLSAYIDATGRVVQVSPRQQTTTLVVDLDLTYVSSFYRNFGDWLPLACVLCCMVLTVVGWRGRHVRNAVAGAGTAR